MKQNTRLNRLIFLIVIIVIIFVVLGSLLVWHSFTQPPTPPQATCGTVIFLQRLPTHPVSKDAQQIENCFSHAYQQCTATTMKVSEQGVDTGDQTIYWPHQQGDACQIIAQSSSFGIVGNANSTKTETCQAMIYRSNGILIEGCSSGNDKFIIA